MKLAKSTKLPLYLWFLQVITLWGLMSILIWLILRPKDPIYKVVDACISNINYNNSTLSHHDRNQTVHQNVSITIKIEISNTNKRIGIDHDGIEVALYHSDWFVGNNSVAGFHLGYRKTSFREVEVNAYKQSSNGIIGRKSVDLRICLKSGVRYVYGIFRYRTNLYQMDFDAYMKLRPVPVR